MAILSNGEAWFFINPGGTPAPPIIGSSIRDGDAILDASFPGMQANIQTGPRRQLTDKDSLQRAAVLSGESLRAQPRKQFCNWRDSESYQGAIR
jgi:hypothetical protein